MNLKLRGKQFRSSNVVDLRNAILNKRYEVERYEHIELKHVKLAMYDEVLELIADIFYSNDEESA